MHKINAIIAALAIALASSPAFAGEPVGPLQRGDHTTTTSLSSVPLDGSGASLAFTRATAGYDLLIVTVNHDANVTGALTITMICTESPDGGTTNGVMQTGTVTAGVFTSVDASFAHVVAATGEWSWRVDIGGYKSATCTAAAAGSAAGDTLSAITRLVTK